MTAGAVPDTEPRFDLALTEEQALVQRTAREWARDRVLPLASEIDERAALPRELVREMGELGFMGIDVPDRWGGAGLDTLSYTLVGEEINRACASTGVTLSAHVSLACSPLLHFGTDTQKERFLTPLARGEKLGCFALSEPSSGSDAAAMRTTARRDGDAWVISGTKNFITNGAFADLAIVFAQADPDKRHRGVVAFVVEKGTPGLTVGKLEKKLGIRGSDTAQLHFSEVRVPDDQRIGEVDQGFAVALSTLDGGRVGIAAQAVGIARACLEDSLAYAKERHAFGRPIAEHQAIQGKLADMATEIDAARLLVWRAAAMRDRGERYGAEAAMAKLFASDVAVRAARECVQIFGGYGFLHDFPAERHYRDAKITEIYEGTSEIMQLVIAQDMLRDDR